MTNQVQPISKMTVPKNDKLSIGGVANATIGSLTADGIKSVFTSENNKPATKGDLIEFIELMELRYHPVHNLPQRYDGAWPYYDLDTGSIIYFKD